MSNRRRLLSFLALQKILVYHPKIARGILDAAGDSSAIFEGRRERFRQCFGNEDVLWERFRSFQDFGAIERDLDGFARQGIKCISIEDERYPQLLREIYDPPLLLYMKSADESLPEGPSVAIVGSRKAAPHSVNIAAEIAEGLAARGVVVASGMAYGVDAAAHRGALLGCGKTIAVLGCGPDIIYPSVHADLARRIAENGAIISEFLPGTRPNKFHFPQRNRIISGLCIAAIIVEAAERSGSLITARFAVEQGREVMSVPGPAGHPQHRGTNRLIREGAALVECAEDVLELISRHLPEVSKSEKTGLFEPDMDKDSEILKVLKENPEVSADEIVFRTGFDATRVFSDLAQLVIAGKAEELPGGRFCLARHGRNQKGNV